MPVSELVDKRLIGPIHGVFRWKLLGHDLIVEVLGDSPLLLSIIVAEMLSLFPVFNQLPPASVVITFHRPLGLKRLPDVYTTHYFELVYMNQFVHDEGEV